MDSPETRHSLRTVKARRISTIDPNSTPIAEEVNVVVESPLVIEVEAVERYTVLCTPIDRKAMAVGFLFSEGVIDSMDDISSIEPCKDDDQLWRVKLKDHVPHIMDPTRNLLIVSSCGACGTEELDQKLDALPKVGDSLKIESRVLRTAIEEVSGNQPLFKACGGTHAIGLFDSTGKVFAIAEDTGRHNALDKTIGKCLIEGIPLAGSGAVLSGRVSLEMAGKCARAGIELISAISAPTSLAIEVADRCNITLCAFVRKDRATIFTHTGRVLDME